jgi:integrase
MRFSRAILKYLAMKQVMGISYNEGSKVLNAFCRHVADVSIRSVAKWQVLEFLERSVLSDVTWLFRYRTLKAFFEYWMARDQLDVLPMPNPRRPGTARVFVPYIYSVSEVRKIIRLASLRRRPRKSREMAPGTFHILLLFLYSTGARINEALSLSREDVDLSRGTVTFRGPLASRIRTIPIGANLLKRLREYAISLGANRENFFVRENGKAIRIAAVSVGFQTLRCKAGLARSKDISRQPRVQDLRRTFAVHCMREWLKQGKDLRIMLPVLGAYLGHVSLTSTEAYLAVTPERFSAQLLSLGTADTKLGFSQGIRSH